MHPKKQPVSLGSTAFNAGVDTVGVFEQWPPELIGSSWGASHDLADRCIDQIGGGALLCMGGAAGEASGRHELLRLRKARPSAVVGTGANVPTPGPLLFAFKPYVVRPASNWAPLFMESEHIFTHSLYNGSGLYLFARSRACWALRGGPDSSAFKPGSPCRNLTPPVRFGDSP